MKEKPFFAASVLWRTQGGLQRCIQDELEIQDDEHSLNLRKITMRIH